MSVFATFSKGGIHPADKKTLSKNSAIVRLPLPEELVVSMSQHLGAPAKLLKTVGEHVSKGEKIGEAAGFISANVHSPVDGTIVEIRKASLANGVVCDAAVIRPDEVQSDPFTVRHEWADMTSQEIIAVIKEMGISGQGGATFPANVKFSIPEGKTVDALVINGVECEPYLTSDYRLMMEKGDELLEGVMILNKVLSPKETIIGIEANKMDAVAHLDSIIKEKNLPVRVQPLKMKYPQGDEKQLLKATMNREIPSGKLPIDIGGVVVNAGSAWAVFNAVVYSKPLIERIVCVTGECIANPSNFIAPIGTKARDLIAAAGGLSTEPDKLISGGPMMGFAFFDEDTPTTKGSSGILAIKDEKSHVQTACISCGRCVAACPIGLQPTKLYRLITNGEYALAMSNNLMDCKECGCCAYSCPAHLELVHAFKTGKKMGRKK